MRKIQNHKEERDRSGKFKKNKKERKKEIVAYTEVPILMCSPLVANSLKLSPSEVPILMYSPLVANSLKLSPSCDPPSEEPTPMGTSPTTKTTPSMITSNK
jgi:hypothetical protein